MGLERGWGKVGKQKCKRAWSPETVAQGGDGPGEGGRIGLFPFSAL